MLLLVCVIVPSSVPAAKGTTILAGACVFTMTLSNTTTVMPLVDDVTWSVNGGGPCTDNFGVTVTGSITGSVTNIHMTKAGCAGGVFMGTTEVDVTDAFPSRETDTVIVTAGANLVIAGARLNSFVGGGTFVNVRLVSLTTLTAQTDVLDCVPDGDNTLYWKGVYTFVDPELA